MTYPPPPPGDPYAADPSSYGNQAGYPSGSAQPPYSAPPYGANPQAGYPTQAGYPAAGGYPGGGGYPAPGGYPGAPGGYPAGYAQPPSIATTVVITLFFGLFGLIPASIHTSRAREMGQPSNKYWKAFGWTFGVELAVIILIYVVVIAAATSALNGF